MEDQRLLRNSTRILLASALLVTSGILLFTSQARKYRAAMPSTGVFNNSAHVKKSAADYGLAIKAMGIGTLLAVGGIGITVGGVSKVMGVETAGEFGERMTRWMGGSKHDLHESERELQALFHSNNKHV